MKIEKTREKLVFHVSALDFIEFVNAFPANERFSDKALNEKGFKNLVINPYYGELIIILDKGEKNGTTK